MGRVGLAEGIRVGVSQGSATTVGKGHWKRECRKKRWDEQGKAGQQGQALRTALKMDTRINAYIPGLQAFQGPNHQYVYGITQMWNQIEITHYRLATFANETIRATEGVRTELTALRLTAMQNHMALDMLLAACKKGQGEISSENRQTKFHKRLTTNMKLATRFLPLV
ncbi:hypothetical protein HF521_007558 [Silurus meridionalis]|uniref:Uncharacterized protein n=1 Tax=Silurus meridionalis TaxID=175797 RepID=A0A8T0APF0_SILME|nr:hypothetical protein HF521_007558 [Silurus meridionalis]